MSSRSFARNRDAATPAVGAAADPAREAWIDAARGACVLAVVLFHVCLWQYLPMSGAVWQPAIEAWSKVNGYLASLRMPLLMAISGLLAARRIRAGWGRPGAAVRAASSYYLYVVWLLVYALFYLVVGHPDLPHDIHDVPELLRQLLLPETPLWFIFALALYVVVLTSLRRVPPVAVLGALTAVAVAVTALDPAWPMFEKVPENFVYFAIGVYGGDRLRRLVGQHRARHTVAVVLVGIGSILLAKWSFGTWGDAIVEVARGALFILVGALVVAGLVRWEPLSRVGSAVGRRTLQVYVFHALVLMTIMLIIDDTVVVALTSALHNPVLAVTWPLIVTGVVVTSCLVLHRLLVVLRMKALFGMPAAWAAAIARLWSSNDVPTDRARSNGGSPPA